MRLRDRIFKSDPGSTTGPSPRHNNHEGGTPRSSEYCKRFNKGKCNLGSSCKYEHRCLYCNKFSHGMVVCRKLIFDREKGSNKRDKDSNQKQMPQITGTNSK